MHKHVFTNCLKSGYEYCSECGTYHSIGQVSPKEIYEEKPYWGEDSGRSTLEQQISNMTCTDECGISKVDRVMQFIPYERPFQKVLEIACAPGVLLGRLGKAGYETYGIEPSDKYIPFICSQSPTSYIIHGYFPEVTNGLEPNQFDCIVGLDVMEHIDDYIGFWEEVHRLLAPNGTAVIMSPIILNVDGFARERDFVPSEHAWIFSEKFLSEYLGQMFSKVEFKRWIVGHEVLITKK